MKIIVLLDKLKKVTAVADELGMKQPTVSFHMRKLEDEWGMPLFETKTGKVLLTEAGRALFPYAQQIDRLYEEAQARARELRRTGRRKFVIGCTDAAAALLLRSDGGARLPAPADTTLAIRVDGEQRLRTMLRDGEADFIVSGLPGAGVSCEPVAEYELVAWAAADHPLLRSGREVSIARLAELPLVMLEDDSLTEAIRQWETGGRSALRFHSHTDRLDLALGAVRSGEVAAILPYCGEWERGGRLRAVRLAGEKPIWRLHACWRTDFLSPQITQRLAEALKERRMLEL